MLTLTVNGESRTLPSELTVAELLERLGYDEVLVTEDLAGRDRIVEGKRP